VCVFGFCVVVSVLNVRRFRCVVCIYVGTWI